MESTTYLKDVKSTPKKLRMYVGLIKKMSPQEALDYLMYSTNKQSRIYYKAVHSAIANATNTLKVSPDMLQFKLFTIEEGRKLRRYTAGSRGTAKPLLKRFSHIKIVLVEKAKPALSAGKKEKSETKEVVKAEPKKEKKSEAKTENTVKEKSKRVTKKVEVTNKE